MKLLISTFVSLLLIGFAGSSYGQDFVDTSVVTALKAQKARLEAIRAESFSPEKIRSRKTRAGLAGGGRIGLGGFGAGVSAEEEKIYNERLRLENLIATISRQISELRALSLRQRNVERTKRANEQHALSLKQRNAENSARGKSIVEGLSNLNEMHEQGILTDEEFVAAKNKLLGLND